MSYQANITQAALANTFFRRELYTTPLSQVVLMSVEPGDDIGMEVHHLDQILTFVAGTAETVLNGHRGMVGPGDIVVVPAGTEHNFINVGAEPLKLYTVYSPPEHAPGTIHKTKAEADAAEAAEHGHGAPAAAGPPPSAAMPKTAPSLGKLTVGSLLGKSQV